MRERKEGGRERKLGSSLREDLPSPHIQLTNSIVSSPQTALSTGKNGTVEDLSPRSWS